MGLGIIFRWDFPADHFQRRIAGANALFVGLSGAAFDRVQKFVGIQLVLLLVFDVANILEVEYLNTLKSGPVSGRMTMRTTVLSWFTLLLRVRFR